MIDNYIDYLQKDMNVSQLNRNVISNNIANYNTPGFKASTVFQFDDSTNIGLKTSDVNHIPSIGANGEPSVVTDTTTKAREDGNNVDLDTQMTNMLKNNNNYSEAVQALNKELFLMRTAMGR